MQKFSKVMSGLEYAAISVFEQEKFSCKMLRKGIQYPFGEGHWTRI